MPWVSARSSPLIPAALGDDLNGSQTRTPPSSADWPDPAIMPATLSHP
jgi:hypothetical protein